MSEPLTVGRRAMAAPLVNYQGWEWVGGNLPCGAAQWAEEDGVEAPLREFLGGRPFVGPLRDHHVVQDIHGDAGALLRSLVASGAVAKIGPDDADLEITPEGRDAVFVIGGDMFGTGPSNLRVLGVLDTLIKIGGDVQILAGNQELRLLAGLRHLGDGRALNAHLFVRLGKMGVRLVQEVLASEAWRTAAAEGKTPHDEGGDVAALERLLPPPSWYAEFPEAAAYVVPRRQIGKETLRIREKVAEFRCGLRDADISPSQALAAARFFRRQLLSGPYRWFTQRLKLALRAGSYLFVHAGVGDGAAAILRCDGVDGLNRRFARALRRGDEVRMYHGPLGNCARTRYRLRDEQFTEQGIADLHAAGVYAVVHGHGEAGAGIQVDVRRNLVDIGCDLILNANARASEGVDGPGAGVLSIRGDGQVWGASVDFPAVKVLNVPSYCELFMQI